MKEKYKPVSLHDKKEMMELMRKLYGNDEVKDDSTTTDTKREPGAKGSSEMVKLPPNCS